MKIFGRLFGPDDEDEHYVYPLRRTQQRSYEPDHEGNVYFWDIDKTYLVSEHDGLRDLIAISLEFAIDKRNVAATDVLLRALRRGPDPNGPVQSNPLYFVSASPPQLRSVIERKMLMDGVEYDGITFKDQLALLKKGKVGRLRAQVGYKLSALLLYRWDLPWGVRETLFGDDSEADALIYALYGDIVAGRLRGDDLARTLRKNDVMARESRYVTGLAEGMQEVEIVDRIYINMAVHRAPGRFSAWGPRLVACYDTFQMALHLFESGKVGADAVVQVGHELVSHHGYQSASLMRNAVDLIERRLLSTTALDQVWGLLREKKLVPTYLEVGGEPEEAPHPTPTEPRDFLTPSRYLALV